MTNKQDDSIDIFAFNCPHDYLKAIWEHKKRKNPSFSLRSWGKRLGFANNSTLTLLINKKRLFSKKQALRIIKDLKLNSYEAEYLEAMVDFFLNDTAYAKKYYLQKMKTLKRIKISRGFQLDSFEYLASPHVLLLFELISLKNFKNDLNWLQEKIDFEIDKQDIKNAIAILKKLNLICEDSDGILKKTENSFYYEGEENFFNEASVIYHRKFLENLLLKINKYSSEKARFSGYFFNIEIEKIKEAMTELYKFHDHFISKYEAKNRNGEVTYQFGYQFVPCSLFKDQ